MMDEHTINIDLSHYKDDFKQLNKIWYKDISVNAMRLRVLGIHYMDNGPEWTITQHKHSFFECHYVTKDHVYTTANGIQHKVTPGQFYLLAPGVIHGHCQKDRIGHVGFSLRFEIALQKPLDPHQLHGIQSKQMIDSLMHITPEPYDDDGSIINMMLQLLELGKKESSPLELQLAFFQIIIKLVGGCNRYLVDMHSDTALNKNMIYNNIILTTIQFIEDNYNQDIDVKDVANCVHLSYSHLSRLFKSWVGETVSQYIKKVRLNRAIYLLKCTQQDITCIARDVGYNSAYYFSNDFKKNMGVSPGNYRKTISGLSE